MSASAPSPAELSKALYGSSHMHDVIVAIARADGEQFSAPQLMADTGLASSIIHGLLTRLLRARMIERSGALPGERTLLYRARRPNDLNILATLADPPPPRPE